MHPKRMFLTDRIASINPAFLRISISLIQDKFCLIFFISNELSFMSTHPPFLIFLLTSLEGGLLYIKAIYKSVTLLRGSYKLK